MDWPKAQNDCICPQCPTFIECGEKLAFCMPEASKSGCIKIENGCLCPGCPVHEEMNFNHDYYCLEGNEKTQSGK
jgi:hypothetical protein